MSAGTTAVHIEGMETKMTAQVNALAESIHSSICETSLADCLAYRGRCVKAAEAALAQLFPTVNSAEGLDALPSGSVITDKFGEGYTRGHIEWFAFCSGEEISKSAIYFPVTVRFVPEVDL